MSEIQVNSTNTEATHPEFPDLKIGLHPYHPYNGQVVLNLKDEGKTFGGLLETGHFSLIDYLNTPIDEEEERSQFDMDIREPDPHQTFTIKRKLENALSQIHPHFYDFLKGKLNLLDQETDIKPKYRLHDKFSFPYSKNLKNVVSKPTQETITTQQADPWSTIQNVIATNMIKKYMETGSRQQIASLHNLVQQQKNLLKHKLPETYDIYSPYPHLTSESGLDTLKGVLAAHLSPHEMSTGIPSSIRSLDTRRNIVPPGTTPSPMQIHRLKMVNLAREILQHFNLEKEPTQ